jgi:uncharacterized membrane protein YhaH (DUF805 family)
MADLGSVAGMGSMLALFAALGIFALVLVLAFYVYVSLAVMTIAKKTKTPNAWLAWIPIANYYLMTQIAGVSGLWTLALLLTFIPVVGGLAVLGVSVWLIWRTAEKRKFPGWISLLMIIPVVNLIVLGILAWAK